MGTVISQPDAPADRLTDTEPEAFAGGDPVAMRQARLWRAAWRWPADATGVYALSNSWPDEAQNARTAFVDQYSGEVLANHGWRNKGVLSKATSFGIIVHMGRQYGPVNAMVMGGACLAIIVAVVTSPVMFWKRRPKGTLGTPRRPLNPWIPRQALIVAMGLGVLYPMLGVSMVAVAAFDQVVVRNVGSLRRAFGMS